jgi:acyl-CoA thioesterase-1
MRKYWIWIISIFVIAIAIIGFFAFRGKNQPYTKPTAGENIIFFGDSLVAGVGSDPNQDLPAQLSKLIDQPIINAGISGDTTVGALNRLDADVLNRNPKVVIILLGGNDFLQQVPEQQTEKAIRNIVERILQTGSGVILINENKILGSTGYYSKLASEKHIPYIENLLGEVSHNKNLMSDTIHPNSQGYSILAAKIQPVLENYLK